MDSAHPMVHTHLSSAQSLPQTKEAKRVLHPTLEKKLFSSLRLITEIKNKVDLLKRKNYSQHP